MPEISYPIALGEAHRWCVTAMPGARRWADGFARALSLVPGSPDTQRPCSRMLFFVAGAALDDADAAIHLAASHGLPDTGWTAHGLRRSFRLWSSAAVPDIILAIRGRSNHATDVRTMQTAMYGLYVDVEYSGGTPIHASLVEHEGKGILLAGPCGAGKSTACARLPAPWRVLSDDLALVVRRGAGYAAHPLPTWSRLINQPRKPAEWDIMSQVALNAVFFIEQDGSDAAVPTGRGTAAALIHRLCADAYMPVWSNLSMQPDKHFRTVMFENACALAEAVPTARLAISRTGRFWEEIERVL